MEIIKKYFDYLTERQVEQLTMLKPVYEEWNAKINVISRKDMDEFYIRHVIHSMLIAKFHEFKKDEHVLDLGTGGGFPGIPLAIMHPESKFTLVDSIGKKIKVVNEVCTALSLTNVTATNERAENLDDLYDTIMSRAVAPALKLVNYSHKLLQANGMHILLKGGDLAEEKKELNQYYRHIKWRQYDLSAIAEEEFFETKKIVILKRSNVQS